jgi:hypothetical protein
LSLAATEQSKDEFMTACLADGVAEDVCEARWKAAQEVNQSVPEPAQRGRFKCCRHAWTCARSS